MPDGKSVVLLGASQGAELVYDYDVFQLRLDDGAPQKLTTANGHADSVRPSPDGKVLIFVKWRLDSEGRPGDNNLYLLDLQARELKPLKLTGIRE